MRFRVKVNGEHLCDAGVSKNGTLSLGLFTPCIHPSELDEVIAGKKTSDYKAFFHVGGSENIDREFEDITQLRWVEQAVAEGDQILIEILPDGEISEPTVVPHTKISFAELPGGIVVGRWLHPLLRLFRRRK